MPEIASRKMANSIRRVIKAAIFTMALVIGLGGTSANACPNCKFANETEDNRPRAYMYSILFMIGMPATIFTGFGISFYRMVKKAEAEAAAADLENVSVDG